MKGYEGTDSGLTDDGLLPTGDLGYLDTEGFLWLVGRKKEMVNRGGETLAPQEVEEALIGYPWMQEVAAFAVPHGQLGETLGLAVALREWPSRASSADLLAYAAALQELLGCTQTPGLIAFLDSLPRTAAGKVQRLSLFDALRSAGGPEEANSRDVRCIVLDARRGSSGQLYCRHLVPSTGTVASLFLNNEGACTEATEIEDSLGQRRKVSQRERFEQELVLQMYIVAILGVTLIHFRMYAQSMMSELTPPLQLLTMFLTENKWHLQVFFAGAAYLDREQALIARDLVSIILVLVLPLMYWLPIVPSNQGLTDSWFGLQHPARWFFLCLSAARFFSLTLRAIGISKGAQVLLALPYAVIWPNLCISACSLAVPGGRTDIVLRWVGIGIPQTGIVNKLIASTVTYVVCLNGLPPVVRYLARAGPNTNQGERQLGLWAWLLLTACILLELCTGWYQLEQQTLHVTPPQSPLWPSSWQLPLPVGLPLSWLHIALLAIALAYLPFTAFSTAALRSLLAALLLMPVVMHGTTVNLLWAGIHHFQSSSAAQLLVLSMFFSIFLAVLAPLLQTLCLRMCRAGCRCLISRGGDIRSVLHKPQRSA